MAEPLGLDDDRSPTPRFLTVDRRVPEPVRQLVDEADGCLNMAFVVGGSACIRRAIRKTLETEGVEVADFAAAVPALAGEPPLPLEAAAGGRSEPHAGQTGEGAHGALPNQTEGLTGRCRRFTVRP